MPDTCPCRQRWREGIEEAISRLRDLALEDGDRDARATLVGAADALALDLAPDRIGGTPDCICSPGVVAAARALVDMLERGGASINKWADALDALAHAVKESDDIQPTIRVRSPRLRGGRHGTD